MVKKLLVLVVLWFALLPTAFASETKSTMSAHELRERKEKIDHIVSVVVDVAALNAYICVICLDQNKHIFGHPGYSWQDWMLRTAGTAIYSFTLAKRKANLRTRLGKEFSAAEIDKIHSHLSDDLFSLFYRGMGMSYIKAANLPIADMFEPGNLSLQSWEETYAALLVTHPMLTKTLPENLEKAKKNGIELPTIDYTLPLLPWSFTPKLDLVI